MLLIIASLLLSACAPWNTSTGAVSSCLATLGEEQDEVTGVFVQPDDGFEPVLNEIEAARCTIDLTMYMLTADEVFSALAAAEGRGVRVRVILEQHPFGMFGDQQEAWDRLTDADIDVQWEPEGLQFSHAKYMVIDGRTALITNQNFTVSGFTSNREFGVITTSHDEVEHARTVFESDWSGEEPGEIDGPLVVSPDNSRERLLALIDDADTSIDFYAEIIRDDEVLAALEAAVERGVRIRLIMNGSLDPEDEEAVARLLDSGIQVRLSDELYIHAKTMVIDGDHALVGSINYSMTSLDRNREVAMVVDHPHLLTRITTVFERDWIRSAPLAAMSPPDVGRSTSNLTPS